MNQLIQDVSFAVRQLRKAPGFTLMAILTLALGIGANAAIFTLVHAELLRNLPVSDPKTLVRVGDTDDCCVNGGTPEENDYSLFSYDLYKHLRDLAIATLSASAFAAGLIPARRAVTIDPVKALRTE
jgi:macrolide transport system ATP-binding/permease protein